MRQTTDFAHFRRRKTSTNCSNCALKTHIVSLHSFSLGPPSLPRLSFCILSHPPFSFSSLSFLYSLSSVIFFSVSLSFVFSLIPVSFLLLISSMNTQSAEYRLAGAAYSCPEESMHRKWRLVTDRMDTRPKATARNSSRAEPKVICCLGVNNSFNALFHLCQCPASPSPLDPSLIKVC